MLTTKSYFLTTHSGSFPRTKDLVDLYVALSRGEEVDKSKLEDAIYTSTEAVIQNGNRHAWRFKDDEVTTMLWVLIGTKRN